MTDRKRDDGLILPLEMIQKLYDGAGEDASPLPTDRTGGLRFRRGVPEALLHLSRNNRSEVARLVEEAESARRRALAELRNGSTSTVAAVLYWHCPDFGVREIADAFGLGVDGVRRLADENPTVTFGCLDCDTVLRPKGREHFREMLSTLRELNENPNLHARHLYTGLHCERCQRDRENRWGEEWHRQESEYQERLLELRALPYEEYLRSAHWRRKRIEKMETAGRRCELCGASRAPLEVHHRTYRSLGEEQNGDLIVLCRGCHKTFHRHRWLGQ